MSILGSFVLSDRLILDRLWKLIGMNWEIHAQAGRPICVQVKEQDRSIEQNSVQWPILQCWAEQKEWPVNGKVRFLTKEEWKDILTASFEEEEPQTAPTLDGKVVLLGQRTSQYSKKRFSLWIEFLKAASAQHGINLGVPTEDIDYR